MPAAEYYFKEGCQILELLNTAKDPASPSPGHGGGHRCTHAPAPEKAQPFQGALLSNKLIFAINGDFFA